MAYDLAAMRAHARFLLRDPAGDAINNNDLRDFYLNPAYRDWWRRFEHRPANVPVVNLTNPGDRFAEFSLQAGKFNDVVYRMTLLDAGSIEVGARRSEYNRVRYLQESEGAHGFPREWGALVTVSAGSAVLRAAFYPIPNDFLEYHVYCRPALTALAGDTTAVVLDNVSARYVTRIASYRAALDLKLDPNRIDAIIAPLPPWVKAHFNIDYQSQNKALPKQDAMGYELATAGQSNG